MRDIFSNKDKNNFQLKNTKGTALLLSLLILSGVLSVGAIMAGIVIREIRQSQSLDRAIVSYYAAESGAEHALFDWRKYNDNDRFFNCREIVEQMNWRCSAARQPVTELIFNLDQMQIKEIPLYQPGNLSQSAGISRAVISWNDAKPSPLNLNEPWLEVALLGWPAGSSLDFENNREIIRRIFACAPLVAGGKECSTITIDNFISSYSYIVRIRPLYDDVSQVTVKFYDTLNNLVDLSTYILAANFTGNYGGIKQAIRLQLPISESASAMFDFVISSEEDIDKIF